MAQNLSNLPVGAKVKFGKYTVGGITHPITWLIVAKNHSSTPSYPSNSVTLLSEKIIDCLAVDALEPSNSDRDAKSGGNANYPYSNIDQWLNKDNLAGAWYVAAHSYDQAPTNEYVLDGRGYANRSAFLNEFSSLEKNVMLSTTISVTEPLTYATLNITRKVFLPSMTEVGGTSTPAEGAVWEYFSNAGDSFRRAYMSSQLFADTTLPYRPSIISASQPWGLRGPDSGGNITQRVMEDGRLDRDFTYKSVGIRPATCVLATSKVTDTTDGDGCYTFVWNSAPPKPTTITTPTIYGGKSNSISWSKVTDPDGDAVTYQLECSVDGGSYTQIYSGTALSYNHLVTFGASNVTYRVKATDSQGASSEYTSSTKRDVINNYAPVISGTDANLGVKSAGFTGTYTIQDTNNNGVTVTEAIDGVQIRSLVATLGATITYGITNNTWLALANGSHTLTIRATDGIDTAVRTYTFTKLVNTLKIQNSTPWDSSTMPSRIMLVITRNLPSTSTFKVEVANNGYDASPTWEDCTDKVRSGLVHVFANTTKTAGKWGVLFRVTVDRNGATGACYISAIGGNFE